MYPISANATRIRYLESTGTQWIDTGSTIRSTWSISVTCSVTTTPDNQAIWTARKVTTDQPRTDWRTNSLFVINITNPTSGRFDYGVDQIAKLFNFNGWAGVHEYKTVGGKLFIDGTKYAEYSDLDFETGGPLRIFAGENVNEPGTFNVFCVGKIYVVKVLDASGATVRSFVPCRVGSVGYLFDRVSGQLFGNAGTGDFVLGPDTFAQGVVPTRMMPMGVRKKEALGSVAFYGAMDSNLAWTDSGTSGPGAFTFSAWVKAASAPTRGAFAKIGNRQVWRTAGAGIGLGFGSSRFDPSYPGQNFVGLAESVAWANSPSNASTINSWHHYAATLSGYVLSVYIDGQLFWTNSFSNVRSMSPFVVYIGGNRGGGSGGDTNRFLACNMTRSAMWNRALSASEVAQDYADRKKSPTITNGLQHYWPMSNAKNYLKDEVGAATLTAGVGGVTISTDTPFA